MKRNYIFFVSLFFISFLFSALTSCSTTPKTPPMEYFKDRSGSGNKLVQFFIDKHNSGIAGDVYIITNTKDFEKTIAFITPGVTHEDDWYKTLGAVHIRYYANENSTAIFSLPMDQESVCIFFVIRYGENRFWGARLLNLDDDAEQYYCLNITDLDDLEDEYYERNGKLAKILKPFSIYNILPQDMFSYFKITDRKQLNEFRKDANRYALKHKDSPMQLGFIQVDKDWKKIYGKNRV